MSVLRRWSTPCLWLALLTYLMMAGLDEMHTHWRIIEPSRQHPTTVGIADPIQDTCPLCAWHAMTTASCRLVMPLLIFPAVITLATVVHPREARKTVTAIRARAPPSLQASFGHFSALLLPIEWRNS